MRKSRPGEARQAEQAVEGTHAANQTPASPETKAAKVTLAVAPTGPIVVISHSGSASRAFASLASALDSASTGDDVELRGDGPFLLPPMRLHGKALTLRAARGFRPVISAAVPKDSLESSWIQTDAPLLIEGLDLQSGIGETKVPTTRSAIVVHQAALRMANCRLLHGGKGAAIRLDETRFCRLKNNLMFSAEGPIVDSFAVQHASKIQAENCVFYGFSGLLLQYDGSDASENAVDLRNSTLLLREAVRFHCSARLGQARPNGSHVFSIKSAGNIFDTDGAMVTVQPDWTGPADIERIARANRSESAGDMNPMVRKAMTARSSNVLNHLKNIVTWHDERDLYSGFGPMFAMASGQMPQDLAGLAATKTPPDWNQYWGNASGGLSTLSEGPISSSVLRQTVAKSPASLTPGDFTRKFANGAFWLRPTGSRLEGARVAIVGPGFAYEKWLQTVDYHAWTTAIAKAGGTL
jgi:hypothetical protein